MKVLKLIWKRTIGDNFTDSNGDADIVRIVGFAAAVIGLVKFAEGTADANTLIVILGGLATTWAAKASDPKPPATEIKIDDQTKVR